MQLVLVRSRQALNRSADAVAACTIPVASSLPATRASASAVAASRSATTAVKRLAGAASGPAARIASISVSANAGLVSHTSL